MSNTETPEDKKPKSKLVGCLSLIVIFFSLIVMLSSCDSGEPEKPKPKHSKTAASVMAEQFVEDRLKSPGSADFQSYSDEQVTDLGGGKYVVKSYVDSQNGFGALVRTHFVCTVKYKPETDDWHLENLQTQQQ